MGAWAVLSCQAPLAFTLAAGFSREVKTSKDTVLASRQLIAAIPAVAAAGNNSIGNWMRSAQAMLPSCGQQSIL